MNKYLLPVTDDTGVWIEHTIAKDSRDAEDKFMQNLMERYSDCDLPDSSWNDFLDNLENINVYVGGIYDIEEF